ncbi:MULTISPECIES: toxic anion resistance protein [Clostridium]|uniref:Toxic anion resistance protein n=3 Tax=Clostridium TaxID=1485 RepID=A0A1B9BN70_CLOBE|nr:MULTISPECIES: toxic anion resistance protein [Clostridium]ABR32938.1 toxic anion resistance family protein [Clostridium beijerinckii NCIMB 8052]AIU03921.1 toxic anion resistance family protein [Clostridium beijerinckii ATCC 35702]ALB47928.1 toxic anion resistance protein [Clostridium beijerinckii NRRL B-598]AQS03365.1 TelA-like protein [Clostridium beijerinckii]AVK49806.1 tellurium resistance protein [Clostridium sp. MF28]
MNDGFKEDIDMMPSLTFEPFEEEVTDVKVEESKKKEIFDESYLTEDEKKMINEFVDKIDINNTNSILQYGVGAQKKIADFSETALNNVKTKDLGEVGEMLTNVVCELKNFESVEEKKGFLGLFKKSAEKISQMKAKYEKVEGNINKICSALENHQIQLLKDIAMLDKMYEINKVYFKELSMYILAGKKKLSKLEKDELPKLAERARISGLPEDAQATNDFVALCNRFDKKIHDLELTRMISLQMAPQIRLVQNNDSLMSEKIQSTLVNTIPLWKSQIVLALGVAHSNNAAKVQNEVTNMTNELLRKNAETLKMSTIETAKESERGIVDIETLKNTNESLISTLDEVLRIQIEGREKRKAAEAELQEIEGKLKDRLLQMRQR